MPTVPTLLSMDEAMVGFSDAARRRDISRAIPAGQGMQLHRPQLRNTTTFLAALTTGSMAPRGACRLVLCMLCASRQCALCAEADAPQLFATNIRGILLNYFTNYLYLTR